MIIIQIYLFKIEKVTKTLLLVEMYLITLCQSPFSIMPHVLLLHSISEQVTDISKFLSEMNDKLSSMEDCFFFCFSCILF